jgi:hypothetical protein
MFICKKDDDDDDVKQTTTHSVVNIIWNYKLIYWSKNYKKK